MAFQWSKDLMIGIETIDNQHKEIFSRLNTLLSAMDQGKGREEVNKILEFLSDYVKTHFSAEEELMTKHNYDGYVPHKAEHTQFIRDYIHLKKEFNKYGATLHLVVQAQKQVGEWLSNHIKTEDTKIAKALKKESESLSY
jgi:hemerythrin